VARTPAHSHIELLAGNLLSHTDAERFEYDAGARLAVRTRWDGRVTKYRYDNLGQLIEVDFSDGEASWRAGYDALGRRIWREFAGKRTEFYWDGDRLAAEIAPDGALRIYVYPNTDALVPFMWLDYSDVNAAPEDGEAFFLFTSGTGMPLRVEDQAGRLVWRAEHIDAYGAVSVAQGATVELRLRFAGHFLDEHTGLFYNRHRDYDPNLCRYLQPDPIDFAGGINLYAYPSNPVVDVDLLGLAHRKQREIPFEPKPVPEHLQKPLNEMSPDEMKQLCKHHADELARAQDTRPGKDTNNTFAVGVAERTVKGPDGEPTVERRLVATSNLNEDDSVHSDAKKHMQNSNIEDRTQGEPPHLTRQTQTNDNGEPVLNDKGNPKTETVKTTTDGDKTTVEPYDKKDKNNTEHHAEQRMENAKLNDDEKVVAQSPSQGCCDGCQKALGTPDDSGQRPIDKIPADRQSK
jgi:RHS repeat-associated protein